MRYLTLQQISQGILCCGWDVPFLRVETVFPGPCVLRKVDLELYIPCTICVFGGTPFRCLAWLSSIYMTVAGTVRSSSIISNPNSGIEILQRISRGGIGHNSILFCCSRRIPRLPLIRHSLYVGVVEKSPPLIFRLYLLIHPQTNNYDYYYNYDQR